MAADKPSFGYLLRRYRLAALLTQEQLAERAHLSYRTISDLERGAKHTPRRDTILLLADALELAPEELVSLIAAAHPRVRQPETPKVPVEQVSAPVSIRTFLIADLRGYTAFTDEQGDEAAYNVAERFATIARETASAHQGEVIELRGDEALAVFSSARQALRAAIALQDQFAGLSSGTAEFPLQVGIGLDAGEAIPLEGGYRGGALNLAARLCSLAGPGEVLASEGIVHLARKVDGLGYLERGAMQLKGFADPVRVVQVVPEESEQTIRTEEAQEVPQRLLPIGGFLGSLPATPLVGRDGELDALISAVNISAGGNGRLVFLTGEPGVGKTRLAQEATLHLRNRGFVVASGRCYEPQQSVPFYPFLEVLEDLYLAAPSSTRSMAPQRWPYLGRMLPNENLPVPPASFDGREEQERLLWSVTGFVQTLAEAHPVALLVDDLHWADDSSLALLQHLARRTRAHSVLLLGTYRDVVVAAHHPLEVALRDLNREQLAERLLVRRLGQDGTAALIAATFGQDEVSSTFVDLVYRHTDGNPFFTHEVLRALVERGDIYRENGRWGRREVTELSVPETVRSAIGERIARMPEKSQELLHEASVLGQAFRFDDLQAMSGQGEEEVERALEGAEAAGLVRAIGTDDYTFNHALTQHTLYSDLSPRMKRRLHLAAGAALKQLPERKREQRAAELARHFFIGDDPERALPYVLEAGDHAEAVFAHAESERQYRTALKLAQDLEDQAREAEAREKLGRVLALTAQLDEALEVLERAAAFYRTDGNREGEARATLEIGLVLSLKGRISEAVTRLEQFLERLDQATVSPAYARLYSWLAIHLFFMGRYQDMLTATNRAVELALEAGDERSLAEAKHWQGTALGVLGRNDDARGVLEDAVALMERLGVVHELRTALSDLGAAYHVLGELERTKDLRERALSLAEQVGETWQIAISFSNLGEILFYLGDWSAARNAAQRAAEITVGTEPYAPYPPLNLGVLDLAEGRWEEADRHMAICLGVAEQHEDLQALREAHRWLAERDLLKGQPWEALARLEPLLDRPGLEEEQVTRLLSLLASAYLDLGNMEQAESVLMKGLERASRQSHRLALVELLRVQGMLRAQQGRWEEADQAFREAVSLARTMPYPYAEARILYQHGRTHMQQGEPDQAQEHLENALAIFRCLGAQKDVEKTEQSLGLMDRSSGPVG